MTRGTLIRGVLVLVVAVVAVKWTLARRNRASSHPISVNKTASRFRSGTLVPQRTVPESRQVVPPLSSRPFVALLERFDRLHPGDQAGLDALFAEGARLIRGGHASDLDGFALKLLARVEQQPVRRVFFLLKLVLDHGPVESAALRKLLSTPSPRPNDTHHGVSATLLAKIFVLERIGSRGLSQGERSRLLPLLIRIAKHERSLAVARGAAVALVRTQSAQDPVETLREIRQSRRPSERSAFDEIPGV